MAIGTKGGDVDARTDLARRALDLPRATLDDIAGGIGTTRGTLAAYRTGHRPLPAETAWELARWLRDHAGEALSLAAELDRVGDD